MKRTTIRPSWTFDLARHDIRSTLPAAVRAIVQNGFLESTFEDALKPGFLFPALAGFMAFPGSLGDNKSFTRTGLLTPTTTPLLGSDPSPTTYSVEQFVATLDQYGNSMDTNMLSSATAAASKYVRDVQTLGINAAQSINRLARNRLYGAYGGGRTWAPNLGSATTTLVVADATGFSQVLVNGVPTAVSSTNTLGITIGGTAATVTGVNLGTNTLTLSANATWSAGAAVVANNAPVSIRPLTRNSPYEYVAGDVATLSRFRAGVARLRTMNVPTIDGYYIAHVDAVTEAQLFDDADFKQALQGRIDSPVFQDLSIGRFAGIDFVRNIECPNPTNGGSGANLSYRRALLLGADALVATPMEGMTDLLSDSPAGSLVNVTSVPTPADGVEVALITRAPQDRLGQVVTSTWSWVGDFAVPSDSTTGDSALYKRGVVIEHAG